jgi:hypothetical protein
MTSQINTLQQAVESLTANMTYVRAPTEGTTPIPPSPSGIQNLPQVPVSPIYPMLPGPIPATVPVHRSHDSSLRNDEPSLAFTAYSPTLHPTKDPIWGISKEDAIRLTLIWKENLSPVLPIVNIDKVLQHIDMLYSFLGGAKRAGLTITDLPGADAISDGDTLKLKLVLATALAIEGSSDGDTSCKLFASVVTITESLLFKPVDLNSLELLVITVSVFAVLYDTLANSPKRQYAPSIKTMRCLHGVSSVWRRE